MYGRLPRVSPASIQSERSTNTTPLVCTFSAFSLRFQCVISALCGVMAVRFGVLAVRYGVPAVRFGVLAVRFGVLAVRFGVPRLTLPWCGDWHDGNGTGYGNGDDGWLA